MHARTDGSLSWGGWVRGSVYRSPRILRRSPSWAWRTWIVCPDVRKDMTIHTDTSFIATRLVLSFLLPMCMASSYSKRRRVVEAIRVQIRVVHGMAPTVGSTPL